MILRYFHGKFVMLSACDGRLLGLTGVFRSVILCSYMEISVRLSLHYFEAHAQQTEGGVEFWLARDLQYLLGYAEWRNFTAVIIKAKIACEM